MQISQCGPIIYRWIIFPAVVIFHGLLYGSLALAHDSRPLFINITEYGEDAVTLRWKTPPTISPDNLPHPAPDPDHRHRLYPGPFSNVVPGGPGHAARLPHPLLPVYDNRPLRLVFSYALGIVSTFWFIERFALAFV